MHGYIYYESACESTKTVTDSTKDRNYINDMTTSASARSISRYMAPSPNPAGDMGRVRIDSLLTPLGQ